jgi:hypothetical protein
MQKSALMIPLMFSDFAHRRLLNTTRRVQKRAIRIVALLALVLAVQVSAQEVAADAPDVNMIYVPASDRSRLAAESLLLPRDLFLSESKFLELFVWSKPITVWIGDCKQGGSEYVPNANVIQLCLSDAISVYSLYHAAKNTDDVSKTASQNTMVFVLLHEAGHAFVSLYNLPTTGSQEDAADEFAALVMATQPNARQAGLFAAYWFLFRGRYFAQPTSWDSHDADARRSAHIACLIDGAFPGQYARDLTQLGLQPSYEPSCIQQYQRQRAIWSYFLTPHLKNGTVWW